MRVALPDWTALALFVAIVLVVTLCGLCVAGHFPSEHRRATLRTGIGGVVVWGTIVVAAVAGLAALNFGLARLPGYAVIIGGCSAVLAAPMVLQRFSDTFLDGRRGLISFSLLAAGLALLTVLRHG